MQLPQSLKAVWYKSWTQTWAFAQAIPGAVLLSLSSLSGYINDPTIKSMISELDLPKTISIGLVVLGIVTYVAHGRSED